MIYASFPNQLNLYFILEFKKYSINKCFYKKFIFLEYKRKVFILLFRNYLFRKYPEFNMLLEALYFSLKPKLNLTFKWLHKNCFK